jgi:hypothetical protein
MIGKLALVASAAGMALTLSTVAVSASTTVGTVSGFEISATSTDGQFVGVIGGGPVAGGFYANVIHDPLSASAPVAICGTPDPSDATEKSETPGSLCDPSSTPPPISTVTVLGGSLTGTFAEADKGITNLTNPAGKCSPSLFSITTQKYEVAGTVTFGLVPFAFAVVLTHYLFHNFGTCQTLFATISGTLSTT